MDGEEVESTIRGEYSASPELDDTAGPLVSVIVPVYQVEQWLRRCLDSILRQSYPKLDIVLIDDGSTDRSPEICDSYSQNDQRVRVLHQPNRGVSAARNAGVDVAVGDFITFIDSDDWVHEDFVAKLLSGAQKPATICVSRYQKTATEIATRHECAPSAWHLSPSEAMERMHTDMRDLLVVAWGKLYPRELLLGVRFAAGRIHEDQFTTYKILAKAESIVVLNAALYYYFDRPSSIMNVEAKHIAASVDYACALQERISFLRHKDFHDAVTLAQRRLAQVLVIIILKATLDEDRDALEWARRESLLLARNTERGPGLARIRWKLATYALAPRMARRAHLMNVRRRTIARSSMVLRRRKSRQPV